MAELIDFLEAGAKLLGVGDDVAGDVADAFDSVNLRTLGRFEARPILLGSSNAEALDALQRRMVDEGMDDDDDHKDLVGSVLALITKHLRAPDTAPGGAGGGLPPSKPSEDEVDQANTTEGYARVFKYFHVLVDLKFRCNFVGKASRELKKSGLPGSLPSFGQFTTQGMSGLTKSVKLGGSTSLTIGEEVTLNIGSLSTARFLARAYFRGVAAVFTWPLDTSTYGGRDVGYVNHDGKQVRLLVTLPVVDDLLWEVIRTPCTTVAEFTALVDKVVLELLTVFCRGKRHPDEIIKELIEREGWWHPPSVGPKGNTPNERARSSSKTVGFEGEKPRGGGEGGGLICSSWLNNGACNKDDCPGKHPKAMAGLMKGRGKGKGRAEGGGGRKRGRDDKEKEDK